MSVDSNSFIEELDYELDEDDLLQSDDEICEKLEEQRKDAATSSGMNEAATYFGMNVASTSSVIDEAAMSFQIEEAGTPSIVETNALVTAPLFSSNLHCMDDFWKKSFSTLTALMNPKISPSREITQSKKDGKILPMETNTSSSNFNDIFAISPKGTTQQDEDIFLLSPSNYIFPQTSSSDNNKKGNDMGCTLNSTVESHNSPKTTLSIKHNAKLPKDTTRNTPPLKKIIRRKSLNGSCSSNNRLFFQPVAHHSRRNIRNQVPVHMYPHNTSTMHSNNYRGQTYCQTDNLRHPIKNLNQFNNTFEQGVIIQPKHPKFASNRTPFIIQALSQGPITSRKILINPNFQGELLFKRNSSAVNGIGNMNIRKRLLDRDENMTLTSGDLRNTVLNMQRPVSMHQANKVNEDKKCIPESDELTKYLMEIEKQKLLREKTIRKKEWRRQLDLQVSTGADYSDDMFS